ncbi:hypothetical protein A2U01_0075314, partial [Trifolium medium]|nr:hypothetical protein [Trifolium medium]
STHCNPERALCSPESTTGSGYNVGSGTTFLGCNTGSDSTFSGCNTSSDATADPDYYR